MQPELVGGVNGVFDVAADGELIFSKNRAMRFPDTEEIIGSLDRLK